MRATTNQERAAGAGTGHDHCLICGEQNPWSRRLRFSATEDGGVHAEFQAQPELQGYDGILHGGVICALLDAAMTHCLFHRGVQAVTGELNVRFHEPVPCNALIRASARVRSAWSPLFCVEAELRHEEKLVATASAKFILRGYRPEPFGVVNAG